mgnify:CR=1 FL=1
MTSDTYLDLVKAIERMHRQSLDTVKIALETSQHRDMTPVQAMMLVNLGGEALSVGELGRRGAYVGSNISYNVKRMVENGYIVTERSELDRRTTVIRETEKGREVADLIRAELDRQRATLETQGVDADALASALRTLGRVEGYWGQIRR